MPIIAALGRQRQNLRVRKVSILKEAQPPGFGLDGGRFEIQSPTFPLYCVSGPSAHSDIGIQGFSAGWLRCQHAISLAVCLASSESCFRPQDKCHMFNGLRPPLTFFLLLNKKFLPLIPLSPSPLLLLCWEGEFLPIFPVAFCLPSAAGNSLPVSGTAPRHFHVRLFQTHQCVVSKSSRSIFTEFSPDQTQVFPSPVSQYLPSHFPGWFSGCYPLTTHRDSRGYERVAYRWDAFLNIERLKVNSL